MRHKTGNGQSAGLDTFLEDVKTVVRDGQELLKAGVSGAKEKALAGARSADEAIRRQPYQTMAIIFGAGILVGLLAAGAFSRSGREEEF